MIKQTPLDPNRGDLFHEIIKQTNKLKELASQLKTTAQNKIKRSLFSLDKIVKDEQANNIK